MTSKACPEPGIYQSISQQEYRRWDAVSHSRLSLASRSPAHYRRGWSVDLNRSLNLSALVHCGVLDPLAIAKRYCFMPDYSQMPQNTNAQGQRSYSSNTTFVRTMQEKFRETHPNQEVLPQQEYERMVGIARSLYENDLVRDLLRVGKPDVCIVWDDKPTGLRCKTRADWLRIESGWPDAIVVDLVTNQDVSRFDHAIATYGYHRRLAFQQRGLAAAGFAVDIQPWLIAVETQSPYGCRTAPLSDETIAIGHNEVDDLLHLVSKCRANASWPGYENPTRWEIPNDYTSISGSRHSSDAKTATVDAT